MKRVGPMLAAVIAVAATLFEAGSAQALAVNCRFSGGPSLNSGSGNKKGGIGGGTTVAFSIDAASQVACFDGNDSNTVGSDFALFGQTGWILADKNDDEGSGDGKLLFASAPRNGVRSGLFSLANPFSIADIVVTLKASSGYAAFLIDGLDALALTSTWTAGKDLSHSSVYYRPRPTTTLPPVPLPAGGVLLGSALLGVAALRRGLTRRP